MPSSVCGGPTHNTPGLSRQLFLCLSPSSGDQLCFKSHAPMLILSPPPQLSASGSPGFPPPCIQDQSLLVDRALVTSSLWKPETFLRPSQLPRICRVREGDKQISPSPSMLPLLSLCPVSCPFHGLSFTATPASDGNSTVPPPCPKALFLHLCPFLHPSTPVSISAPLPFSNTHQSRTVVLFAHWIFSLGASCTTVWIICFWIFGTEWGELQVHSPPHYYV